MRQPASTPLRRQPVTVIGFGDDGDDGDDGDGGDGFGKL